MHIVARSVTKVPVTHYDLGRHARIDHLKATDHTKKENAWGRGKVLDEA